MEQAHLIKTNCNCIQPLYRRAYSTERSGLGDGFALKNTTDKDSVKKKSVGLDKMLFTQHHIYLYNWGLTYFPIVRRKR